MGTSTRERLVMPRSDAIVLPLKCRLSPFFFFRTVMLHAEFGLMEDPGGL